MNIKSLLLGSAAALAAVSGAQAADAIVAAEPEPMEYVRVCDAFGTGYFYIPGTETCLKIGGYIRYDVEGGELLGRDSDFDGEGDSWDARARFMLNVSTAADTELGALKTYAEVRFNYNGGPGIGSGSSTSLNFAYIDLAGFRVGKDESAFTTFVDYAGNVINDDLIGYGPFDVTLISYTFNAGNGFTGVISLEDDEGAGSNYVPNVAAGIGYKTDTFGIRVVGGYDEDAEEGAVKVRLDGNFGGVSAFIMAGWNTDGDTTNFYGNWNGDWALWGGFSAPLTERVTFNTQLSYTEDEDFAAVANVNFTVVPGFVITPEIAYVDNFSDDIDDADSWGGMVRFQRSF